MLFYYYCNASLFGFNKSCYWLVDIFSWFNDICYFSVNIFSICFYLIRLICGYLIVYYCLVIFCGYLVTDYLISDWLWLFLFIEISSYGVSFLYYLSILIYLFLIFTYYLLISIDFPIKFFLSKWSLTLSSP